MNVRFFLCLLGLLALASCNVEKKYASEFVQKNNLALTAQPSNLILFFPDSLLKTNAKLSKINDFDLLDPDVKAIIMRNQTHLLSLMSDVKFKNEFQNHLVYYLKLKGLNVDIAKNKDATRYKTDSNTFIFKVVQMEAEETATTMRNETYYTDERNSDNSQFLYYEHPVDVLNLNLWYSYQLKDSSKVYYNSFSITDDYKGYFYIDKDRNVKFKYTIGAITSNEIYALAKESAKLSAGYIYDFLMNQYITQKTGYPSSHYYSINKSGKITTDAKGKRFAEVK